MLLLAVPLALLVLLEAAYLLRRPLFEGWIRREASALLGGVLGGEVEIGALGGDWVTTFFVTGVQIRGGDVVRHVEDGAVELQIDPLALVRRDMAGIARARVSARLVDVALPAASAEEEEPSTSEPFDPVRWLDVLPGGAHVRIDRAVLRTGAAELDSPVAFHLAPQQREPEASTALARPFSAQAFGVAVDGNIDADGHVLATARADDVGRLVHLFAPELPLAGGRIEANAEVTLAPELGVHGRVHVADLAVQDEAITRLHVSAAYAGDRLTVRDLELVAPGVGVRAHGVEVPLTGTPLPESGSVTATIEDLSPYAELLPDVVREQLPLTARLRARVVGGSLLVEDGFVRSAAARVILHSGSVALAEGSLATPLRFDAVLLDPERLPLPADLPFQPERALVDGTLRQQDGRLTLDARLDVTAQDPDGRLLAAAGTTSLALEPALRGSVDLALWGDALPLGERTHVTGAATWNDGRLQLDEVRIAQGARQALAIDGTAALGGDLSTLLAESDLAVRLDDLELGPVLQWLGVADVQAGVRGDVQLAADKLAVTLAGEAAAHGEEMDLAIAASWAGGTVTLEELRVRDGRDGTATVRGTLALGPELDWRAALQTGADLHASVEGFDPSRFLAAAGGERAPALRVFGDLDLVTTGPVQLDLRARATGSLPPEIESAAAEIAVRADAERTTVERLHVEVGPAHVDGSGALEWSPLALLSGGGLPDDAAIRAELTLHSVDLATVRGWLDAPLPFDELRGTLDLQAEFGGTLQTPDATATLRLADAALRTTGGQRLDDIEATITVTPSELRIGEFKASRGKGPILINGGVTAPGPWWRAWQEAKVALEIAGDNVLLHRGGGVKVRADLALAVNGPLSDLVITGRVDLHDSKVVTHVPLIGLRRTGGDTTSPGIAIPSVELPPPLRARLDLQVVTAEPFEIKSNLLEGGLDVQLALLGDLAAARVQGTVSGPDVAVILPGVRMRASTLLLQFTAQEPRYPTLTLNARGRRHGFDIQVSARGRYDRPDVVFTSDPVLPPDELVVLVTTGARPSALRTTSAVGTVLGAYVAEEFADWIFGSESTEAKESFLDRFTIETGTEMSSSGNESIVVEFRVGERTYLQGERDVYDDINMGVVYRIRFR